MKYRIAIFGIAKKCYVILTHRRFIPVCTGNINALLNARCGKTVYPCVYREHRSHRITPPIRYGLSLCVQGTLSDEQIKECAQRFIPVCTGNIPNSFSFGISFTVYPCVYREHKISSLCKQGLSGLSLCVQGTYQL